MIPTVLMLTTAKGGVGKTMLTANVAALAAAGGWRVLAVDLDEQGNLALDLGYADRSDHGANLMDAIQQRDTLRPVEGVRERLDVVPGGRHLAKLPVELSSVSATGAQFEYLVEDALLPVADRYDLIVVDSPPTAGQVHIAAYTAALGLVIPVLYDDGSLAGVTGVYERLVNLKQRVNPDLTMLGVVLNRANPRGTAMRKDAMAVLEEMFGGEVPLIEPVVREATAACVDMRRYGIVASEYEQAKAEAPPWYDAFFDDAPDEVPVWSDATAATTAKPKKKGKKKRRKKEAARAREGMPRTYAGNTTAFAEELSQLTDNILTRFQAAQAAALERRATTGSR